MVVSVKGSEDGRQGITRWVSSWLAEMVDGRSWWRFGTIALSSIMHNDYQFIPVASKT